MLKYYPKYFLFLLLIIPVFTLCFNNTASAGVIFYDNFEGSTETWSTDGFWHLVGPDDTYQNYHSSLHAWWYGQDTTGDYDNGATNTGRLISPQIDLTTISTTTFLSFWFVIDLNTLRGARAIAANAPKKTLL